MTEKTYEQHQHDLAIDYLDQQIERAERMGVNGKGLFNETGYRKWNELHNISAKEINERAINMAWFLDGMDGWLAKRLAK